uniref:beta-glucosidase 12-like n=1 Tax=Fragaria vesca subsp. vesca TaxID=101020 RepID=UPI0005C7F7A5|nr:PREDICTED: beta-glucosidase 12-like [Fragaria vesca subsp. vesca]
MGPQAKGSVYIFSYPQGLQKLLKFMKHNYQCPKIYITENVITEARKDTLALDAQLRDPHRIECILGNEEWGECQRLYPLGCIQRLGVVGRLSCKGQDMLYV